MSAFNSFELHDHYVHNLCRNGVFTRPRFSCSFHSPLAHAMESAEDYLDFEFDILHPSSTPVDRACSYCLHPHYHHHQYHPFPLLLPHADFFDAASDLIFHNRAEAELCARGLGDRLATLELGFDRDIAPQESKWKWTAEIKGNKREGFDQKYKCTAETKGAFKRSSGWTIEYRGKGKYAFDAASVSAQDVWGRKVKKEKKVKKAMARPVEIDGGTDQHVVSKRQALAKRTVHGSKGKKKELSPQDAAMAIQKSFRDHISRRSHALRSLRDLAVAKSKLKEIRALFSNFSYRHRISKDAEERQRFSEKIIILLVTVDAIEGQDFMVRSAKRSMTRELEAMLEAVDPQPFRPSGSRRRKFDLPVGSFSTELSSGVADVVRMLDQEDGSSSILPHFSL